MTGEELYRMYEELHGEITNDVTTYWLELSDRERKVWDTMADRINDMTAPDVQPIDTTWKL